jgi:hypothetical protein
MKTWHHHLQGAHFTLLVQTDHVTLRYFATQPRFTQRQVRGSELLADFDLRIEYKP